MDSTNILIVEDNVIFSMDLKNTIVSFGFKKVIVINKFNNIVDNIIEINPDILIMDISLSKDLCGIEIVKEISENISLNVIYISADSADETIQKAIDTNPYAYLNKPIKNSDLKAFLLLILKESKENKSINLTDKNLVHLNEDISFDMDKKLLFKKDRIEKLGSKETKILSLLIRNKGKTVLFKTIEDEVWGDNRVSNDSIRGVISRLRKRVGAKLIKSVYSLGFKII